jgi:diguanylate cyclase (GGDEF)-like protein/PAS domain S-box-containing protein
MRDIALNQVEAWVSSPTRFQNADYNNQVAAIANLWQFWLDAEMAITVILPPGDADFSLFPCGPNAIGCDLFKVLDLSDTDASATEFCIKFRAFEKIQNARFVRKSECALDRTLIINGTPVWSQQGDFEGYRCTVSDVSKAVRASSDLDPYEAVLGAFIRHVPNLIVVKDVEGRYLAVNPLAERSYGMPRGKLIGKTAQEALPPEFAAECNKGDNAVLDTEVAQEIEQNFRWPDGAHTFHTVKFPIFDAEHSLVGTGAIGIDITQHKRIEEDLYHRANYDAVTELPNRRLVMDRLDQAMAMARRAKTVVGLVKLDVGDFTAINEAIGRVAADWLLIDVAGALREICRETDTIGRCEGDTFCIVLPNLNSAEELDLIAAKLLATLRAPRVVGGDTVHIHPSIGTALFPCDSQHGEDMLRCAKMALDHAKARGRSTFERYKTALSGPFVRRMKIENQLRDAVERSEFNLVYQPLIDAKTAHISSVEALLRWKNNELGFVGPDEFIPVAEETGLINDIGAWVFKTACEAAKKLNPAGALPVVVAVNFSVKQLADRNIVDMAQRTLQEVGVDPALLKVEMTESAFADDVSLFQHALEGLRNLGLGIALDDFGTGYSSLAYLHRYRFNQLKIDKSFVDNIVQENDGYLLVDSIIRMAHSLRLEIVAEGVETLEQVQILAKLGCDYYQGYFFSKPVALQEIEKQLTGSP